MMKKAVSLLLSSTMLLGLLASCGSSDSDSDGTGSNGSDSSSNIKNNTASASTKSVDLMVVTSYGGDEGNRQNYETAYKAFEEATGHKVIDDSQSSSDAWKTKVINDFATDCEPDVLFYFTGEEADLLIANEFLVSLEEIREEYPNYASNMKEELMPKSTADGELYAVPVNGYWEGLFVNKLVLEESGVEIPDENYDWDTFLEDCQKILDAGYTPIASSLQEVPQCWLEFAIFNHGSLENHIDVPQSLEDETGKKWLSGFEDIKTLYDRGFFPQNAIIATDSEITQMMANHEAAFMIGQSWKVDWFLENAEAENFTVCYIPAQGERLPTDTMGGISMGYYITRKAWENPETRDVAVAFVTAMTSDDVVNQFAVTSHTALKKKMVVPEGLTSLELDAITMKEGATAVIPALEDFLPEQQWGILFSGVKEVVENMKTAEELLEQAFSLS